MGFYSEHVMPRAVGAVCGHRFFDPWRRRLCQGLEGDIIELGFGTGTNLKFLPPIVRRVIAVEPSRTARDAAREVAARLLILVEFVELDDAEALPAHSLEGALCAFTLCTVADPARVLQRLREVLRPGAPLHFLEHGLAPDPTTARWQRRLNGLEQRLAGGCQLTRDPLATLREAGFEIESAVQEYARGPKPWSYFTLGVARAPSDP